MRKLTLLFYLAFLKTATKAFVFGSIVSTATFSFPDYLQDLGVDFKKVVFATSVFVIKALLGGLISLFVKKWFDKKINNQDSSNG